MPVNRTSDVKLPAGHHPELLDCLQAGQTGAALATMQQVQSAAGLDSPEALHQLGQLFRAGLQQPSQVQPDRLPAAGVWHCL